MATKSKARSIQGTGHKRGHKSSTARLNDKTLKTAYRKGMRLEGDDYVTVIRMRRKDATILDTAIELQRTYYGTQALFAAVGLLMRCWPDVVSAMEEADEVAKKRRRQKAANGR